MTRMFAGEEWVTAWTTSLRLCAQTHFPLKPLVSPFIDGWDRAFVPRRQLSPRQTSLSLQRVAHPDWLPWQGEPRALSATCEKSCEKSSFFTIFFWIGLKCSHTHTRWWHWVYSGKLVIHRQQLLVIYCIVKPEVGFSKGKKKVDFQRTEREILLFCAFFCQTNSSDYQTFAISRNERSNAQDLL